MTVKDFAIQLNISEDLILSTLKQMRLRSVDAQQELSEAAMAVVRGELEEKGLIVKQEPAPVVKKKAVRKPAVSKKKKEDSAKKSKKESTTAKETTTAIKKSVKKTIQKEPTQKEDGQAETPLAKQETSTKSIKPSQSTSLKKKEPFTSEGALKKEQPVKPVNEPRIVSRPSIVEKPLTSQKPLKSTTKTFHSTKVSNPVIKTAGEPKALEGFVLVKPLPQKNRPDLRRKKEKRGDHFTDDKSQMDPDLPEETKTQEPLIEPRTGPKKDVEMQIPITVGDFAFKISEKPNLVLKTLMGMKIFASINQNLGEDIVLKLCEEFHINLILGKTNEEELLLEHEKTQDDPSSLKPRAPVVTFMGHVDHGKTSLLDAIRKTKVADSEHGGITQHIAAYSVPMEKGSITFLDTPGHAAFTAMRSRGAHITDLVVVVIAADEGIMPQTEEAIAHATAAQVPIVIALNKMDRQGADPERVKKQLAERNLLPEDWGGKTVVVPVSAHTGMGIDQLLEMILLESEILELKANPDKKAAGIVVEAHLSTGKGAVATMIVQSGTLKQNDLIVVGPYYGRVKAMFDDRKKQTKEAGPCQPVEVLGLSAVPDAGEKFFVLDDEKKAKDIADKRQEKLKADRLRATSKITLEDLFAQKQEGETTSLNILLKADMQGSAEALRESLLKIPADNKEVAIHFVHVGVGDVNASDITLAYASKAIVIGFSVGINADANAELQKTPVDVRQYHIIYDAVDDIRTALEGLLRPDEKRIFLARAEVLQVFKLSKSGIVAGCMVKKGKFKRNAEAEVFRNGIVVHKSKLSALKRFKDDVKEVSEGMECGISVEGFDGYQVGDVIEAFFIERTARKLND